MNIRKNECIDAALEAFAFYGITPEIDRGSKHYKVRAVRPDGRAVLVVVSHSPSDKRRAPQRVRSDVKRVMETVH